MENKKVNFIRIEDLPNPEDTIFENVNYIPVERDGSIYFVDVESIANRIKDQRSEVFDFDYGKSRVYSALTELTQDGDFLGYRVDQVQDPIFVREIIEQAYVESLGDDDLNG
jgi:hypothetical protein